MVSSVVRELVKAHVGAWGGGGGATVRAKVCGWVSKVVGGASACCVSVRVYKSRW